MLTTLNILSLDQGKLTLTEEDFYRMGESGIDLARQFQNLRVLFQRAATLAQFAQPALRRATQHTLSAN